MTNIQAINLLKDLAQSLDDYCELNDEGKTAFRMAITALEVFGNSEQLPSAQSEQTKMIKEIGEWINSGNRGSADYFIVDKIEEIINKYECGLIRRLEDIPPAQSEPHYDEWCTDCKEYDQERHCCPRWNRVIRTTLEDLKKRGWTFVS